jgi:FtsP/CotA-like multicopper oxidase with cupredoxin domain
MRSVRTMKQTILSTLGLAPALLLAALLAPAAAAAAGPITTASSCSATGPAAVTCDLWAKPGTLALPGTSLAAWGYSTTAGGAPTFPGPAIVLNAGDTLTLNLTNNLAQPTSLVVQGLDQVPDLTPVAASGGTHSYTIHANNPGTYLYEAGILPGSEYQVSMGLYGALIVRPAGLPGQAYAGAETAFADEALVIVSEVDPSLPGTAATPNPSPQGFDLRLFAPRYFLVNGVAYTTAGAASIPVTAGNTLLLRYANAGILHRSIGVLGLHQRVLAADGSQLPAQRTMVAETIAPGQTADVLVTLPSTAAAHTLYPVYDASLALNNSTASGIGGMLAFLDATGAGGGADTVGPLTTGVSFSPSTGALAATVSDASTGNANVTAAEWFIDSVGAAGTGTPMTGAFGSPTVAVSATVPAGTIAGLSSGSHTVYVRGRDALGNWGVLGSASFTIDLVGPTTSALTLVPNPASGLVNVTLSGTASDVATGNANVVAAEYTIDAGAPTAMSLNHVAPTASLTATIPAATVNALSMGAHAIAVRSQDAFGNWGAAVTITLNVDKTGPVTSSVAANPPANNGATGQGGGNPSVRLSASVSDATTGGAVIAGAEGFIDSAGANGTGFPFSAVDGVFNAPTEAVYADIPLSTINLLASGNHTLLVHGRDVVGNWGATTSLTYLIDRTAPTFTSITLAAVNPTNGGGITLTVNGATDPLTAGLASGVTGGEYWIDTAAPAPGGGTPFTGTGPMTIATAITTGNHTVGVRIRDAAGNWSATTSGTVATVAVAIFSNGFDFGARPWGWSSASTNSTTRLSVTTTTVLSGTRSLQAQGNNTNFVQHNFGTTANPAWPTYDARFQFNPNGNASAGQDILVAASNTNYAAANIRARVRYRLNAGTPQVQVQADSANTNAAWVNLAAGTNTIEIVYQATGSAGPAPGTLNLYLNGAAAPAQTLAVTSNASVTTVRLGSVTSGGSATLEYFDAFASKRSVSPLFGP